MLWFCDFDSWLHGDDDGQQRHRRRRAYEGFMALSREDGNMQGFLCFRFSDDSLTTFHHLSILIDPMEKND
ncbi:hypothetical protein L195_g041182 [Trifolium pratense]|uniref:Uncharacterized protein n=1 Tax=Trifolium pratense TaxID=57577 RepID=A0A2K3M2V8_TRIPR|nr:hypothetical protein L195_g041182 [Trifolium pratense]